MRIAVFVPQGSPSVHAQALIRGILAKLASGQFSDVELLIYAGREVLTANLLSELWLSEILSDSVERIPGPRATSLMKALPNGQRCRVLTRELNFSVFRRASQFLLLSFFSWWDKLDLIHSLGFHSTSALVPEILTAPQLTSDGAESVASLSRSLRGAEAVMAHSKEDAATLYRYGGLDQSRILVAPLLGASISESSGLKTAESCLRFYRFILLRRGGR